MTGFGSAIQRSDVLKASALEATLVAGEPFRAVEHIKPADGETVFATQWHGEFDFEEAQTPKGFAPLVLHIAGPSVDGRYNPHGNSEVPPTTPGSVTLHPEGQGIYWRSRGPMDFMHFYLPKDDLELQAQSLFGSSSVVDELPLSTRTDPAITQCLQALRKAAKSGPMNEFELQGWTQMIVGQVLRAFGPNLSPKPLDARPLNDALVAKVRDLIEGRIEEKITLDELAAVVGWDVYRFTRAFRNAVGQTPHQYLLTRRIDRARDMLAKTDEPLAEIAFATGFSSQQHMTNLFSKHIGLSPAKYRKELNS